MQSSVGELAAALVAIDSINPALVPGGAGEREIASFVADWCVAHGFEVEVLGDERPSVVATKRGSGGGRSLLLNGHLDTVGVAGMEAPFEPRIEGDRLYGRGAYDMKGALAAILLAASDVTGLRGDVIVTLVADEELASIGTEAVVERVRADAAIVVEPTELRVAIAHRGFVGFELETEGIAAHGSRPDLGVDAIAKMGPILVALADLDERLQNRTISPARRARFVTRVADRGRPGALELPRELRAIGRAPHDPRRDRRAGRRGAARDRRRSWFADHREQGSAHGPARPAVRRTRSSRC